MCSLNGSTYTKIGTIQRRLAWPLRKDDTQIREAFQFLFFLWEAQWPNGWCAGLRIGQSGFEPWPGHCVVFLGKIL